MTNKELDLALEDYSGSLVNFGGGSEYVSGEFFTRGRILWLMMVGENKYQ